MNMQDAIILPLGSIVILKEENRKIMIISRGTVFYDSQNNKDTFAEYVGVPYPDGFDSKVTTFFSNDDIASIVNRGYSDQDETEFLNLYKMWRNDMKLKYE